MKPNLKIPEGHVSGFRTLTELSEEKANQLLDQLAKSVEYNFKSLAESISSILQVDEKQIISVLGMLGDLHRVRASVDASIDEFVEGLVIACKKQKVREEEYDWSGLKKLLSSYLKMDVTVLTEIGKIIGAAIDRDRVLTSTSIVTDIRPVVLGHDLRRCIILHTLKIEYVESGTHKSSYFALDTRDLEKLRKGIDDALKKGVELSEILKDTPLLVVEYFED